MRAREVNWLRACCQQPPHELALPCSAREATEGIEEPASLPRDPEQKAAMSLPLLARHARVPVAINPPPLPSRVEQY
jgi:hypothetical protein